MHADMDDVDISPICSELSGTSARPRTAPSEGRPLIQVRERALQHRFMKRGVGDGGSINQISLCWDSAKSQFTEKSSQSTYKRPATASRLRKKPPALKAPVLPPPSPVPPTPHIQGPAIDEVESVDKPLLLGALPERDRVALKLGRLIMTAMIQKKEGFRPTSRFFLDKWLQEFQSSTETAQPRSVEMLARLQHARALSAFGHVSEEERRRIAKAHGINQPSKLLTAVACEALDSLCRHFGASQPALLEIRSCLYPTIFREEAEPCDAESQDGQGASLTSATRGSEGPPGMLPSVAVLSGKTDYIQRKFWFDSDLPAQVDKLQRKLADTAAQNASLSRIEAEQRQTILNKDAQLRKREEEARELRRQLGEREQEVETALEDVGRARDRLADEVAAMNDDRRAQLVLYNKAKAARDEALTQAARLESQRTKDAAHISLLETERDRLLSDERSVRLSCVADVEKAEAGREKVEKAAAKAREETEWEAQRCRDALQELERLKRACSDFVRKVRTLLLGAKAGEEGEYFEREHMEQLLELLQGQAAQRDNERREGEAKLKAAVSDKEEELKTYWGDKVALLQHELETLQRSASRRQSLYEHERSSLVKQMHGVHTQLGEAQAAMLRLHHELNEADEWKRKHEELQETVRDLEDRLEVSVGTRGAEIAGVEYRRKSVELEVASLRVVVEEKNAEIGTLYSDLQSERRRRDSLLVRYHEVAGGEGGQGLRGALQAALQDKANLDTLLQEKESCLRVVEEREADVRRALEVKAEQLADAIATLQVKEDQIEQLQGELRELEGGQQGSWRSETANALTLRQETLALHKDKSALLAQTSALHKDNEALRLHMSELEGQWAAMQAAIEDMRTEAARRKGEREELQARSRSNSRVHVPCVGPFIANKAEAEVQTDESRLEDDDDGHQEEEQEEEEDDDEVWRPVVYHGSGVVNVQADVSQFGPRTQVKVLNIIRDQLVRDYVEGPTSSANNNKPCMASRNSTLTLTDELSHSHAGPLSVRSLAGSNKSLSPGDDDDPPTRVDAATWTDPLPQVPETDSVGPSDAEADKYRNAEAERYRWGEWGAALFENPAYRRAFLRAIDNIIQEIRDTCLPQPEPLDSDEDSLDGVASAEALLSSGNDVELRQLLDPSAFGLLKPGLTPHPHRGHKFKPGTKHTTGIHSTSIGMNGMIGVNGTTGMTDTTTLDPAPPSASRSALDSTPPPPWAPSPSTDSVSELSPAAAHVTAPSSSSSSEPLQLEAKLNQLRSLVPYIRSRILFGAHWVSYAEEVALAEAQGGDVPPGVHSLAANLNQRFLQHQGTAHRIDEYLRCLLGRHRTRVSEQAERFHLQQILHRRQASSALLAWADKRVTTLNNAGLQGVRPASREQIAHRTEYHQSQPMNQSPVRKSKFSRKLFSR